MGKPTYPYVGSGETREGWESTVNVTLPREACGVTPKSKTMQSIVHALHCSFFPFSSVGSHFNWFFTWIAKPM